MVVSATVASPLSRAEAERLARAVLRAEGVKRAMLSIAFVGRRRIRSLNRRHFGRDRETDVVAFALVGIRGLVVGDVYCAPEVGARQARRFGSSAGEEVRRLVVHGVLHVLGYDHPEGHGRLSSLMWRRQERLLARLAGRR
ncbi:MAG TPA: rRNA maturation RNase YbeY [Gemmatimonadales bacterium]|nr:rRNA maturation RNase YbeY [Gemmatimonadales bacterium]